MINILYPFDNETLGGGNNFLLNLRVELIKKNLYSSFWSSRVVLINSHHFGKFNILLFWICLKRILGNKFIVIHRIDGSLVVGRDSLRFKKIDEKIIRVNKYFADFTIFQSKWAEDVFYRNYPDASFKKQNVLYNFSRLNFDNYECKTYTEGEKINLLYCSWSTNELKGFEALEYLDKHLDFNAFSLNYVGRIPEGMIFHNLNALGVLNGEQLKDEYAKSDIFLALMLNDACSNALIEAQAVGLLVVFFDSGGNAEIVHERSIKINTKEEIPDLLIEIVGKSEGIEKIPYQRVCADDYIASLCTFWRNLHL